MTNIGFRILPVPHRPGRDIIEKFSQIPTPLISDNMNRLSGSGSNLRSFHKKSRLIGSALTVKTRPSDNLMVHKAIDLAQPGDVIIVDAGGEVNHAIVGEIMMRLAEKKGVAGFVIDGAIRDSGAAQEGSFPVYARGVTHHGPYKDGPGEINVPISIDGKIVNPGDIVVGDEDGVVAVPFQHAEDILKLAQQQQTKEEQIFQSIKDGTIDRKWVNERLMEKGCEFPECESS